MLYHDAALKWRTRIAFVRFRNLGLGAKRAEQDRRGEQFGA